MKCFAHKLVTDESKEHRIHYKRNYIGCYNKDLEVWSEPLSIQFGSEIADVNDFFPFKSISSFEQDIYRPKSGNNNVDYSNCKAVETALCHTFRSWNEGYTNIHFAYISNCYKGSWRPNLLGLWRQVLVREVRVGEHRPLIRAPFWTRRLNFLAIHKRLHHVISLLRH